MSFLKRYGVLSFLLVALAVVLVVRSIVTNTGTLTLDKMNAARASEHVPALVLPAGYGSLSGAQQVLTVINNERAIRHLPLAHLSTLDSSLIAASLLTNTDPTPISNVPGIVLTDTIWGWSGMSSAGSGTRVGLAVVYVDYSWVYNDGWNGSLTNTPNVDCGYAGDAGCNGHRGAVLLANPPGTTLIVIAGTSSNDVNMGISGTGAAAELVWTTNPAAFSPLN